MENPIEQLGISKNRLNKSEVVTDLLCCERRLRNSTLWARIAQNVKKPPLSMNVIDFEFFGLNVSILGWTWSERITTKF